jgi:hypothetical protein
MTRLLPSPAMLVEPAPLPTRPTRATGRSSPRPAARLAQLAVALAALAAVPLIGCARDSKPAAQPAQPPQPTDEPPPPLPPASGTPVGYLIDDPRLQLSDGQRTKLKAIDEDLMGKLTYLDNVARNAPTAPQPKEEPSRGGIGFSASGDRNNNEGGKISTVPEGGKPLPPEVLADNAATLKRIPDVRAQDVRKAIAQVLAVLSRDQQKLARTILVERGVDPDTGRFEANGDPGAIRPEAGPVRAEPAR